MGKTKTKPNTSYVVQYEKDNSFDSEKFLKLRLRVCHDGVSPNKTHCTYDVLEAAQDSIEYIPILAHTVFDEDGKPMFGAHDSHIENDRLNEGQQKIIYDEIPIGLVPSNAENNHSIEEYDGKNYQFVDAYIWREYSNYCEQLLEDAVDSKLSMEISIPEDKFSYNAKEKYWDIAEYKYRGITILNPDCGTGMKKALATTENFELNNDSLKDKMLILMQQLQDCLHDYNKTDLKEGGTVDVEIEKNFEDEVTEVVNENTEEVTEESTDEVTETTEEVSEDTVDETSEMESEETENPVDETEDVTEENEKTEEFTEDTTVEQVEAKPEKYSIHMSDGSIKEFELTLDDITYAIYNLVNNAYGESDNTYYYVSVYENNYVIMHDYWNGKAFKQIFSREGDNFTLTGDRIEVFANWLTAEEESALMELRANYSALETQLNEYKLAEENAQKDALFISEDYSSIATKDEFKALAENHAEFSIDELKARLDAIILDYAKKGNLEFSAKKSEKKKINKVSFGMNFETSKPEDEFKPYGDLFDK